MKKKLIYLLVLMLMLGTFTSCGKEEEILEEEEEIVITNGVVDSPDIFVYLGTYIDMEESSLITNKSYEIENDDIAVVNFTYDGLDCELRASTKYSSYELVDVDKSTVSSEITMGSMGGNNATYYSLTAGRLVFWGDDYVFYCLYVHVTAKNEVVDAILDLVIFENHYSERLDVAQSIDEESKVFAQQIVNVIQSKDMEALADMMYFPQQLGSGLSAASRREFLALDPEEVFTEKLLEEVNDAAVYGVRLTSDGESYIIGSTNRNIRFKMTDSGEFKITNINNE